MSLDSLGSAAAELSLPRQAFVHSSIPQSPARAPGTLLPGKKIHALVRSLIDDFPADTDTFLVTMRENQDTRAFRGITPSGLPALMSGRRKAVTDTLLLTFFAEPIKQFWLINAVVLRIANARIDSLALMPQVISIEPLWFGRAACDEGLDCFGYGNTVDLVRDSLELELWDRHGYTAGNIALLDSGLDPDQELLNNGRVVRRVNCIGGECIDVDAATHRDTDDEGHGTATASILMGGRTGDEADEMLLEAEAELEPGMALIGSIPLTSTHDGITAGRLTSYQVIGPNPDGDPVDMVFGPGVLAAVQDAITTSAWEEWEEGGKTDVILAPLQDKDLLGGSFTTAANTAFDFGFLMIVAGGNYADDAYGHAVLSQPGAAARTLAMGAWCLPNCKFKTSYSHGYTPDGRWKPDLTAPTSIYTVSVLMDDPETEADESMQDFNGTSAATPLGAGLGLTLHSWLSSVTSSPPTPELIYTMMLAFATERSEYDVQCTASEEGHWDDVDEVSPVHEEGAGRAVMPTQGTVYWGTLTWKHGSTDPSVPDETAMMSIGIPLGSSENTRLEAAIWWPEMDDSDAGLPAYWNRSDFDLRVAGYMDMGSSTSCGGTWERTAMESDLGENVTVSIWPKYMPPTAEVPVTWVVWVKPDPIVPAP